MSRVLIVHSDPAMGARLAAAMMEAGLEARVVTSGERAMDRFIQEPADVLVIDYDLEGRDGITTAEAIRWMPGGRRARLVMTAQTDPPEGDLESLAVSLDAYATHVGPLDPRRIAEVTKRAAAVRPHEAETRILSAEQAMLEAEKMRAAASDGWREITHEEPSRAVAVPTAAGPTFELEDGTLDDGSKDGWELDPDGAKEGEEVRRIAATPAGDAPALKGTFERMGFPRVLSRLADKRATGALICIHPPDERATTSGTEPTKVVYFRSGVPVHVRSNVVRECLGRVLQRQRKIGPKTLEESVEAVRRGEGRQGEVLVRMGAISPVELSEALAEQLRVKLFDLFFWERGTFRFTPDRPPPSELIDLEMGLAEIAFRGIRLAVPTKKALDILEPSRDRYAIPRARKLVRFVRLEIFGPGLRELIRMADGSKTVGELLDAAGSPGEAAQLLHAMECLDAVGFEPKPLRAARGPGQVASGSRRAPEEPDTPEEPSAPSELAPPEGAPAMDAARLAPDTPPEGEPAVPVAAAEPDTPAEPISVPMEPPPSVEVWGDEWEASTDSQLPALSEEDGPTASDASGESALADEPPSEEVSDVSGDGPAPGGSGMRAKPESSEALDERVEEQLRAERLFRRGLRALDRAKPDKALESFEKALALCPDEPRFAMHVTYCEHALAPQDEALRDRALERIEAACEAEPDLAFAHLLRARLLVSARRNEEAKLAYARVLELEPAHRAAKAELKELRRGKAPPRRR